jgi:hypothetical protein
MGPPRQQVSICPHEDRPLDAELPGRADAYIRVESFSLSVDRCRLVAMNGKQAAVGLASGFILGSLGAMCLAERGFSRSTAQGDFEAALRYGQQHPLSLTKDLPVFLWTVGLIAMVIAFADIDNLAGAVAVSNEVPRLPFGFAPA